MGVSRPDATPTNPEGGIEPLTTESAKVHLYKVYRPARAAAGRSDLRWHDLRHTGATLAAHAGATTRELMDRLGHSTSVMAMRYQHVADDRPAEIARRLSLLATGARRRLTEPQVGGTRSVIRAATLFTLSG